MKIDIEFTHRGSWYGLPVYLSFEDVDGRRDGCFPILVIPFTYFWIEYVSPVIQAARSFVAVAFQIETDEIDKYVIRRMKKLRRPFTKTFDWPEEACRNRRPSH